MTEVQREQRRYALAISGGFRNNFTGIGRSAGAAESL